MIQFRDIPAVIPSLAPGGVIGVLVAIRGCKPSDINTATEVSFGELLTIRFFAVLCEAEWFPRHSAPMPIIQQFGRMITSAGTRWERDIPLGVRTPQFVVAIADRDIVIVDCDGKQQFSLTGQATEKPYTPFEGITYNLTVLAGRLYKRLLHEGLLDDDDETEESGGDTDGP